MKERPDDLLGYKAANPMVSETVNKIEDLISEVATLQREYVAQLCFKCGAPCCARVHYLFSEKDILFLRLSGGKQRWRREAMTKKGCWFLGSSGCTLDTKSRPFICHRYICPDLEEEIKRGDSRVMNVLEAKFREIDHLRSQLWAEYLDEI